MICFFSAAVRENQSADLPWGKAKEKGAALLLVTGNPESTLGKMADVTLVVKAPKKEDREAASIMPMGTLFEGGSCLVFENLVLVLMKAKNETSESMFKRHANLE